MSKEFLPLNYLRALRADSSLSTTQFALLAAAVLRTDNSSCRVKMSIEGLAKDAKMNERTARRLMKTDEVTKYFSKIERKKNSVDVWFHRDPVTVSGSEGTTAIVDETPQPGTESASAGHSGSPAGQSARQSAFTSAFSANTGSADASHDIKEDKEEGYEYLGTLNSEDFEGFESAESLSFDYLANSTGVAVFDALPNKVEPQAATSATEAPVVVPLSPEERRRRRAEAPKEWIDDLWGAS